MIVDIFLSYIRGVMNFGFSRATVRPKFLPWIPKIYLNKYIFEIPSYVYNSKKIWFSQKSYDIHSRNLLASECYSLFWIWFWTNSNDSCRWIFITYDTIQYVIWHKISYDQDISWFEIFIRWYLLLFWKQYFNKG